MSPRKLSFCGMQMHFIEKNNSAAFEGHRSLKAIKSKTLFISFRSFFLGKRQKKSVMNKQEH